MKSHLQNLIKINGAISIEQFFREALFHPNFGYYNQNNPFGKKGDFITAPEISQVFGELIGAYFINLWQNNYCQGKINLVEMGPGNGTLMKDFLNFTKKIPNFFEQFTISIVEISPRLQKIQKQTLKEFSINYYDNFASFYQQHNSQPIFFVANELFDCFAINQLVKTKDGWIEKVVGVGDDLELCFALGQNINNSYVDQLTTKNLELGAIFEYSGQGYNFMEELANSIKKTKGVALIIDYGYVINEFKSTIQAIKNHQFCSMLEEAGSCDITALVDFFALNNIAVKNDLRTSLISQKDFLNNLGIEIRRKKLLERQDEHKQQIINSAINRLVDKKQMGELFKVLIIW
jgi:SAM-dependent MidA family methyltransferase